MSHKVVDSSSNAEEDVQNTSYPDELLCECPGKGEICPGQNQGNDEDENEQNDGVGVERESVACTIDSTST